MYLKSHTSTLMHMEHIDGSVLGHSCSRPTEALDTRADQPAQAGVHDVEFVFNRPLVGI